MDFKEKSFFNAYDEWPNVTLKLTQTNETETKPKELL